MAAYVPTHRQPLLFSFLLAGWASSLTAQDQVRVRVEENVRQAPNGEVIARLDAGAPLAVVRREGPWVQVVMDGWVWTRSLQVTDRDGLDLVVFAAEGENLRAAPSGEIRGRLERGALLEEVERQPGWIRVRREGWIWGASLVGAAAGTSVPAETPIGVGAPRVPADSAPLVRRPEGFATAGSAGAAILASPDGDTLASALPRSELQVLSRQGNWARVRIEGWTWLPPQDTAIPTTEGDVEATFTPDDLRADPRAFQGRVVTWRLQFISLERAERVRTDFFEGEPFLLTRHGGANGPFVYVAVPPEQAAGLAGLVPLETLEVTGRVRTGASSLTGTPIIDLVSLARDRPGR